MLLFQFERFLQRRGPSFVCGFSKSVFCSHNWQAAAHLRALRVCQQHWGCLAGTVSPNVM